jgi:hypothetical protein
MMAVALGPAVTYLMENFPQLMAPLARKGDHMKIRTLIAGAAVMFLCGGLGVCVAQEAAPAAAPAASAPAPESAPEPAAKPTHHGKHHHGHHHWHHHGHYHGKQHGQQEFTEQELQSASPSK